MKSIWQAAGVAAWFAGASGGTLAADTTYTKDIKPLFEAKCALCHGAASPYFGDFDKDPKKFAAAMGNSEVVLYGGHGRYGSGPDFDDIHSKDGNFVMGEPYEKGHVTLANGKTDLQTTPMTPNYQFMEFSGCTTHYYLDGLRHKPGKDSKNLDLMVTNKLLYWSNTAANVLTPLSGLANGQSVNEIESNLEGINQEANHVDKWQSNGFQDNK